MLLPLVLLILTDIIVKYCKKTLNLADVIAICMIVVDVVTTKADAIAYYLAVVIANMMFVAHVIATKADVVVFCLADVIANCNVCGRSYCH